MFVVLEILIMFLVSADGRALASKIVQSRFEYHEADKEIFSTELQQVEACVTYSENVLYFVSPTTRTAHTSFCHCRNYTGE